MDGTKVVENADAVFGLRLMRRKFWCDLSIYRIAEISTIWNGYDSEDFRFIKSREKKTNLHNLYWKFLR